MSIVAPNATDVIREYKARKKEIGQKLQVIVLFIKIKANELCLTSR
jgi:hypothetical protein